MNKKEILTILLSLIVLSFSRAFTNLNLFINSFLFFAVILLIYTFSKKITAYYYEAEEQEEVWSFQRYGFYKRSYFKNPIPIGLILPFLLSLFTFGSFPWYAVLQSKVEPKKSRVAKKHGFWSFSEMTDWHLSLISTAGICSLLFFSLITYLLNLPQLTKLSIYFACFNLLPLGKLDGSKILFGSKFLYLFLLIIALLFLAFALPL